VGESRQKADGNLSQVGKHLTKSGKRAVEGPRSHPVPGKNDAGLAHSGGAKKKAAEKKGVNDTLNTKKDGKNGSNLDEGREEPEKPTGGE